MTQKAHAKYSASGSKRWKNCPGSVQLIQHCPPQAESEAAKTGTEAHRLLEIFLRNRDLGIDRVEKLLASQPDANLDLLTITRDAALEIQKYISRTSKVFIEQKIDLSFVEPDTFGTGDVAIIDGSELIIIDYKNGVGVVEVEESDGSPNSQLAFYALGFLKSIADEIETVKLVIVQPNAFHGEGAVRAKTYPVAEILAFEDIFKRAIAETKKPGAPLNAGSWCQFCPATTICPAISKQALTQAQVAFKDDFTEMQFPAPQSLSPDQLGRALDAFKPLEFWMKEMRKHAMQRLNTGQEVPGHKLVNKRGRRQWVDLVGVIEKFKEERPELLEIRVKSPAQVEKLASDLKPFVKSAAAMVSSGVTIAKITDKREAVQNAALVFDEWIEGEE